MQDATGETQLIEQSLAGSREAFGILVVRYQSLICSITYSATGDLARSQELAQETFLRAWKNLKQLRELEKFRAWLCRIARNVVNKSVRKQRFDVVQMAQPLDEAAAGMDAGVDPSELAISKEHEMLVWQALAGIPENYREPMVLFYREQQSVRQVAEDLELSEEAVKQRLSRGRQMLRDEVASIVSDVLKRSGPGKAFTIAVLAGLPALVPQAASAAAATVAAKGTPAAKAAFATGLAGAILGPLLGLFGGIIGSWAGITNTKSPRERAFMIKLAIAGWVVLLLLIGVPLVLMLMGVLPRWAYWTSFAVFFVLLLPAITWSNARQRRIQQEDGTHSSYYESCPEAQRFISKSRSLVLIEVTSLLLIIGLLIVLMFKGVISKDVYLTLFLVVMAAHLVAAVFHVKWVKRNSTLIDQAQRAQQKATQKPGVAPRPQIMTKNSIYGAFGGSTIGAVAWIVTISTITGDWLSAVVVIAIAAGIFLYGAGACIRDQTRKYRILIGMLAALGALNLAAINLRWEYWMTLYRQSNQYNPTNDLPRWTMNLIISALILALIIMMMILDRNRQKELDRQQHQRTRPQRTRSHPEDSDSDDSE